jgi:hypothetical protein
MLDFLASSIKPLISFLTLFDLPFSRLFPDIELLISDVRQPKQKTAIPPEERGVALYLSSRSSRDFSVFLSLVRHFSVNHPEGGNNKKTVL